MEIVFLGTGAMVPTKERNHTGILLKSRNETLLFDCGENIQRQCRIANEKITKITRIFITHWHGDHVLGLPGLIQSLNSSKYEEERQKLYIYGQKGIKNKIETLLDCFESERQIEIKIQEISKDGKFLETEEFEVEAHKLDHTIPCIGFKFIEKDRRKINLSKAKKLGLKEGPSLGRLQRGITITKDGKKITPNEVTYVVAGRRIGYISDTKICNACVMIAKDCDVLISESTYQSKEEEKAEQYKHMTSKQAATIASQSNVEKLILTHFSQRYKTLTDLENEAKDIFPNTIAAFDLMRIKV